VDVLVIDPLGAAHGLSENDNTAINVLLVALRELADRTGAAIILSHHAGKAAGADMGAAGASAARGASALVDGARIVRQLIPMTDKEAVRFGVAEEERRSFFRVEQGKANLTPADKARWRRRVPVKLNNGTGDYPDGDTVAVVEDWTPPRPVAGTASDLARVQQALMAAPEAPRANSQARGWVGYLVADVLSRDVGAPGTRAKDRTPEQARAFRAVADMLDGWFADGGLCRGTERDPASGRDVDVVRAGALAILRDDAA
jgi:hypothetical protein